MFFIVVPHRTTGFFFHRCRLDDSFNFFSKNPDTLARARLEASMPGRWRGREASMPGKRRGQEASMPGKWREHKWHLC